MKNQDNKKTLEALAQSRIFFGNLAFSVRRRHGKEAARRFDDLCEAIDDGIRALRESEIINEVMPAIKADALDLSPYKHLSVSKTIQ
jgi:hypothetical protein